MNTRRLEARRITEALDDYRRDLESLAAGRHVVDFTSAVHRHRQGTLPESAIIGGRDGFDRVDPDDSEPLRQLVGRLAGKASSTGSEVVEVRITDTSGTPLGSTMGFGWQPYEPAVIDRAMSGRETLFGNAFRSAGGEDRLGMATPILARDGRARRRTGRRGPARADRRADRGARRGSARRVKPISPSRCTGATRSSSPGSGSHARRRSTRSSPRRRTCRSTGRWSPPAVVWSARPTTEASTRFSRSRPCRRRAGGWS